MDNRFDGEKSNLGGIEQGAVSSISVPVSRVGVPARLVTPPRLENLGHQFAAIFVSFWRFCVGREAMLFVSASSKLPPKNRLISRTNFPPLWDQPGTVAIVLPIC